MIGCIVANTITCGHPSHAPQVPPVMVIVSVIARPSAGRCGCRRGRRGRHSGHQLVRLLRRFDRVAGELEEHVVESRLAHAHLLGLDAHAVEQAHRDHERAVRCRSR